MAFIQVSLFSESLMRTVPVQVILPVDKILFPGMKKREDKPYKTLYLLHGVLGSSVDWVNGTRIQRFAEENDLAVVMPSGDNSCYLDFPKAHNLYGEFVGRELVELTRKMFPLSDKREDTYLGGLSMGGYGALRNGLKYSDTFSHIIALSSATIIEDMLTWTNDSPLFFETRDYAEACFGSLDQVTDSDKNPKWIADQLIAAKKRLPKLYMACGESDSLLASNEDMADYLINLNFDVTFEVGPGGHEWDFWDTYIQKGIAWLPT